jgi:hypothetical protein
MAYFKASGEQFDVDKFLATRSLEPDLVFHIGQPKPGKEGRLWKASGFSVDIGGTFGRLLPQISEAIEFFQFSGTDLQELSSYSGVSDVRLVFSYCPGTNANVCEYLPPNLLAMIASVGAGIDFDVYPGEDNWIDEEHGEIPHSGKGPIL